MINTHWFTSQINTVLQADPNRRQILELELSPSFPSGWQGPNYLRNDLRLQGIYISRKMDPKWVGRTQMWHSDMGCHKLQLLHHMPTPDILKKKKRRRIQLQLISYRKYGHYFKELHSKMQVINTKVVTKVKEMYKM